jgi:hypothetical protein
VFVAAALHLIVSTPRPIVTAPAACAVLLLLALTATCLTVPVPPPPNVTLGWPLLGLGLVPMTSPLTVTATDTGVSWPNGCGNFPASVQFESTVSGGAPPYAYRWSFGDGTTNSTQANPVHSYAKIGTWNVTLKVSDSVGAQAYSNFSLVVVPPSCAVPLEVFSWEPYLVGFGIVVLALVSIAIGVHYYRRRGHRDK